MLISYFILTGILGIIGAYTSRFQQATHHWGRILAGQQSLESELKDINNQQTKDKNHDFEKGYAEGYAVFGRGFQDAITPYTQNIRNTIMFLGTLGLIVLGFIFFKWYIPILAVLIIFFLAGFSRDLFPALDSDYFKRKIIRGLFRRVVKASNRGDRVKVQALNYFIRELQKAETDL